jgi:F0F1-type ATP synthase membrane subunit b/b'
MYGLVTELIDFLWTSDVIGWVAVPFFLMFAIMRFLHWAVNISRGGGDTDTIAEDLRDADRSFALQRQGFSRPQQAAARRQRAGSRFRFRP